MNISILCIGKLKEKYLKDAADEYKKRLSSYVKLEIIEMPDEKAPEGLSTAEELIIKSRECQRLAAKIKERDYVIALDLQGEQKTSEQFSALIGKAMLQGVSSIAFIIGGSLGLDNNITNSADVRLSLSKMTFPHQLTRIILLEQIYRSFKIIRGEPYHK